MPTGTRTIRHINKGYECMYSCTLLEVCIQMWSSILTQQSRKLNNTMGKIKTNLLILRTHFWSEQWLSLPRWGHRDRAWRCTIEAFVDRGDSEIARTFIIPLLSSSSVTLLSFELNLVFVLLRESQWVDSKNSLRVDISDLRGIDVCT